MSSSAVTLESIEAEFNAITRSLKNPDTSEQEQGELAMGRLFRAVQKFNYLSQLQLNFTAKSLDAGGVPEALGILDQFDAWVQKFKQALSEIAKVLRAAQYSIGVQFPFSISVSITFIP